jgi:tetratricopeptide (TPR) repeat protein
MENTANVLNDAQSKIALGSRVSSLALASISSQMQNLLLRMFADPYLLQKGESAELVQQLRRCVAQFPEVSELRVLLGMALCVNMDVHPAIEELKESVRLAPNSFIAQLKLGELWMKLRVCDKAEEHTRTASLLAQNPAQSELARKQAANIRQMKRAGIERGGYRLPFSSAFALLRRVLARGRDTATALEMAVLRSSNTSEKNAVLGGR